MSNNPFSPSCDGYLTLGFMRAIIIMLVRLYQHTAPPRLRRSCRFEPSCSEYMILSIQKFGVLVGIKRGINRLMHCRPPHGGVDNP